MMGPIPSRDHLPAPLVAALEEAGVDRAPLSIFGDPAGWDWEAPRVGMVGTRDPSAESLEALGVLARRLAAGAQVVSGGAIGSDKAAHLATLQAGGRTVLCSPEGLDLALSRPWLAPYLLGGTESRLLILSLFPPGQSITRQTPVIRNRLIAALSDVLVVGEARPDSGTFHCVRAAMDFGVPVFYLTGSGEDDPGLSEGRSALARRRAIAFDVGEAGDRSLAASISEAAARQRRSREHRDRAQLQLFDEAKGD